jgi:hypothetical protein
MLFVYSVTRVFVLVSTYKTNSFKNATNYANFTSLDPHDLPRMYELNNAIFYFLEKCGKLALCKTEVLKNIMPDIIQYVTITHCILLITQETAYNTDESAAKNS